MIQSVFGEIIICIELQTYFFLCSEIGRKVCGVQYLAMDCIQAVSLSLIHIYDRILASRLGAGAMDAILEGQRNVMIGIHNDEVVYVPFSEAIKKAVSYTHLL